MKCCENYKEIKVFKAELIKPKKETLIKTSIEDGLEYYYTPVLSYVFWKRLQMCVSLFNTNTLGKVLDIGYGSGIFFFTLNNYASELHGLDSHDKYKEIMNGYRINLNLKHGSILDMPYDNCEFDNIMCVSVLEHIPPGKLGKALNELSRVLKDDGFLYVGVPVENKITNMFFKILEPIEELISLKKNVQFKEDVHVSSHTNVLCNLTKTFDIISLVKFPSVPFLSINNCLYVCFKVKKKIKK